MTERTFHRGAVVGQHISLASYYGTDALANTFRWQWNLLRDRSSERTGAQLAAAAKPSRQRRKGPIVRFGRKP